MEAKPNKKSYPFRTVTQEKIDAILEAIKEGAPNKYAAEANGISESHFYNLINQGICDFNHDVLDSLPARLVVSLRNIEMEEIISCKKDIRVSEKGHRGAEWTLEHAYWRTFSSDGNIRELAEDIEREKGVKKDERFKEETSEETKENA